MRRKVKLKKHGSNIEVAVYNMPLKKQTIHYHTVNFTNEGHFSDNHD